MFGMHFSTSRNRRSYTSQAFVVWLDDARVEKVLLEKFRKTIVEIFVLLFSFAAVIISSFLFFAKFP